MITNAIHTVLLLILAEGVKMNRRYLSFESKVFGQLQMISQLERYIKYNIAS